MKKQTIKVIAKKVGESFSVIELGNNYEKLRKFVGGFIEEVMFLPDKIFQNKPYLLFLNEEGKLIPLKPNFHIAEDVVFGDCFICKINDEGDFDSVDDADIDALLCFLYTVTTPARGDENPENYMHFSFSTF